MNIYIKLCFPTYDFFQIYCTRRAICVQDAKLNALNRIVHFIHLVRGKVKDNTGNVRNK